MGEKYAQQVVDLIEREDNGTTLPGKRDTQRTENGTKQKRILSDYLHNIYDKFRLETTSIEISKTTFLRTRNIEMKYLIFLKLETGWQHYMMTVGISDK